MCIEAFARSTGAFPCPSSTNPTRQLQRRRSAAPDRPRRPSTVVAPAGPEKRRGPRCAADVRRPPPNRRGAERACTTAFVTASDAIRAASSTNPSVQPKAAIHRRSADLARLGASTDCGNKTSRARGATPRSVHAPSVLGSHRWQSHDFPVIVPLLPVKRAAGVRGNALSRLALRTVGITSLITDQTPLAYDRPAPDGGIRVTRRCVREGPC